MTSARPISFRHYLPEIFRADEVNGESFLSRFLDAFELLFEELEAEIEGTTDGSSGGIPDLFDPDTTPPPQFKHRSQQDSINPPDFDCLNYLASWIALPLRPEKDLSWNREFFKSAVSLSSLRGTMVGLDGLLRAFLRGDLLETRPPLLILSDLSSSHTDVDAAFQLGVTATLGVNTVLGEGPPFFFVCDLVATPGVDLNNLERAARFLIEAEKPAYTHYQLRVRAGQSAGHLI